VASGHRTAEIVEGLIGWGRDPVDPHAAHPRRFCPRASREAIEPGSSVRTDGRLGYSPLQGKGYRHRITFLKGQKEPTSELLLRVHLAASLLKCWLLGTHQGAVSREHLDYCLDEFTFVSIDGTRAAEESSSCASPRKPCPWAGAVEVDSEVHRHDCRGHAQHIRPT
jgi:ISXO2-like transposase domain